MGRKHVIVDQNEWTIDELAGQKVPDLVEGALENGSVVALSVLDKANRPVTLYINGKTATSVVVDLDLDPRPSEISG